MESIESVHYFTRSRLVVFVATPPAAVRAHRLPSELCLLGQPAKLNLLRQHALPQHHLTQRVDAVQPPERQHHDRLGRQILGQVGLCQRGGFQPVNEEGAPGGIT